MNKPQSYEEWLTTDKDLDKVGLQLFLTYKLLHQTRKDFLMRSFDVTRESFIRKLIDDGTQLVDITIQTQEDIVNKGRHVYVSTEPRPELTPEAFGCYIYAQARGFYHIVKQWENKSLWEYVKWWGKRTFDKIRRK